MATKAGLIGRWRIVRHIEDYLGPDATFTGEGVFTPDANGLLWSETGEFRLQGGAPLTASRKYLWRFVDGRIHVDYSDGTRFHDFAPDSPNAIHFCDPDRYEVIYTFDLPEKWDAEWRVRGPRKDYRMVSKMTRL